MDRIDHNVRRHREDEFSGALCHLDRCGQVEHRDPIQGLEKYKMKPNLKCSDIFVQVHFTFHEIHNVFLSIAISVL